MKGTVTYRMRFGKIVRAAALVTAFGAAAAAADERPTNPETAALPGPAHDAGTRMPVQRILTPADAAAYRDIFAAQERGDWRSADKKIAALGDRLLMGHVLQQRYLHPNAYRSKYRELRDWLQDHADHPDAHRIHKLALARKPKAWRSPPEPAGAIPRDAGFERATADEGTMEDAAERPRNRALPPSAAGRQIQNRVKALVRRQRPTQALELLSTKAAQNQLDRANYDRSLAVVARGYYHANEDENALALAGKAARRSGADAPMASWWGGLAAWRLGRFGVAAEHFEHLSAMKTVSAWTASAAAFWAARASLVGGKPERVNPMLARAAEHPLTFYGLLAIAALGETPAIAWDAPGLGITEQDLLARIPAARRALALIEAGARDRAEAELQRLVAVPFPEVTRVVLALAEAAHLPDVAMRLGQRIAATEGVVVPAALYPVPGWTPDGGYKIDRALLYALIRQESRFRATARSPAGARGLMQLMPATARFVAGERLAGTDGARLDDPAFNIALGQEYLQHLLDDPMIGGNLFFAAVAYNAGPGTLQKWLNSVRFADDPLLFIESIRSRETRQFVEHVLTNFWIYRLRLDQETPSLQAVVAGEWPAYIPQESQQGPMVRRAD